MDEGFVTQVLVPADVRPSFVIPVLQSAPRANTRYIQLVDHRGRLASLEPCEPPTARLRDVEAPYVRVRVGAAPAHAVRTLDDRIVVGPQDVVAAAIAPWLKDVLHPLTRLSLAEFAGEQAVARAAAEAAYAELARREGAAVARQWYLDAVLASRVTRTILRNTGPLADPTAVERLLERMVLTVDGGALRIVLPSELKMDHGLEVDAHGQLEAVLSLGGPININRLTLENVVSKTAPQLRREEDEKLSVTRSCAVVIVGNERLFRRLTAPLVERPGEIEARNKSVTQGDLVWAVREDGLLIGGIGQISQLSQGLEALFDGRSDIGGVLVVVDAESDRTAGRELVDGATTALALWREQFPEWSGTPVDFALMHNEVRRNHRERDRALSRSGTVRAVLSLANAWTPRWWAPALFSRMEVISDSIEGWVAAQQNGLLDLITQQEKRAAVPILTAVRLSVRGDQPVERAVAAVANPLWVDTTAAELWLGVAVKELPGLLSMRGSIRDMPSAGPWRYAKVSGSDSLAADEAGRNAIVAVAVVDPGHRDDEARGFDAYVADRLGELGWGVFRRSRTAASDYTIRRPRLPEVALDVKLRTADAWRRPSRGRSEPWRGVVVGESGAALSPDRPVQAIGFDRLRDLVEIVREDIKHLGPWVEADGLDGGLLAPGEVFTGARLASYAILTPREAQDWRMGDDYSDSQALVPLLSGRDLVRFPDGRSFMDLVETPTPMAARVEDYLRYRRSEVVRWSSREQEVPPRIRRLEARRSYLLTAADSRHRIFIRARGRIIPTGGVVVIPDEPAWLLALLSSSVHRMWSEAVGLQRSGTVRYAIRTVISFPPPPALMMGRDGSRIAMELSHLGEVLTRLRAQWQYEDLLDDRQGVLTPAFLSGLARRLPEDIRTDLSRTRSLARLYDDPPAWLLDLQANIDSLVFEAYDLPFNADRRTVVERLLATVKGDYRYSSTAELA